MYQTVWSDIRYAARRLSRAPGFAAAAIATIALGVGLNAGIFSIVNGVLFRGLPAPDPHELVSVYQTIEGGPPREGQAFVGGYFSTSEYRAYRDRAQTLSGVLGHTEPWEAALGGDAPQEVVGTLVTCNYFDVLRQPPALGRAPTAQECEPGADPVVVLGHELWRDVFAADATIVGRTIELNRQLLTVIGVAREGTYTGILYESAFFAPISVQPFLRPDQNIYANDLNSSLAIIGRRKDGASIDQVRGELAVIAAQIDREQPGRSTTLSVERSTPLSLPFLRGFATAAGAVLMAAFGLVLVVACANVANLLLARALTRGREIAVRLSLGASRARIVRQLLAESLLIAIVAGVVGSVVALSSFRGLLALALPAIWPAGIPPLVLDTSPDLRVLSFTLALSFATAILFGLAPALHVSKPDLHSAMKVDSSGVTGGRRSGRLQRTLVGAQVAVCMVLVLAAALLLRGLQAAQTVDPGFVYEGVAYAAYDLRSAGYDDTRAAEFQRRLLESVRAVPGVESAALALQAPLDTAVIAGGFRRPGDAENEARLTEVNAVTPDYFSLLGIPIVRGRTFTDADLSDDARVAIVSAATARNYWPGEEPLGEELVNDRGMQFRVVGVAKDAQTSTLGVVDERLLYVPASPGVRPDLLLVRSRTDFASTAAAIRVAAREIDPGVAVRLGPLEDNLVRSRNLARVVTALAGALGALALVLAAVGIYGVVSYVVGQRAREMGIRLALGARPRDVLALILRQSMRPVAVGAALGAAGALAVSGVLTSVLFGVSPLDPVGSLGAAVFVSCVALTAGLLAGRRVTRADPTATLRAE